MFVTYPYWLWESVYGFCVYSIYPRNNYNTLPFVHWMDTNMWKEYDNEGWTPGMIVAIEWTVDWYCHPEISYSPVWLTLLLKQNYICCRIDSNWLKWHTASVYRYYTLIWTLVETPALQHNVSLLITAVDCGTLTNPANGQVSHTAGATFGQTATYSCARGYNLVGGTTRTCQATGVWVGTAPTCQSRLTVCVHAHWGFNHIAVHLSAGAN